MTKEYQAAYYQANKDKLKAYKRDYHRSRPEVQRRISRRKAGIVDATGEMRSGPCEICGRHADPLLCDHDHATGLTRGWLCVRCNTQLAPLDNPELLPKLLAYLERTQSMPSFRDAVANYKAAKADPQAPVQVNPPEAVKVLETQSTPEVEAPKAAPAAVESTARATAAPVAPLPSTPAVEESRRRRRTKAEMEAARAAAATGAPAVQSSPGTTTATSVPPSVTAASPALSDVQDASTEELVAELRSRGWTVKLEG